MVPSSRSNRSKKSAPRAMAARNSGASDSMAVAEPSEISTMSSMLTRSMSNRMVRGWFLSSARCIFCVHRGQAPKFVKVKPLQRCAPAKMFESNAILGDQFGECSIAVIARQTNRLAKQFKVDFRSAPPVQGEQQITGTLQQVGQNVGPNGERRRRAEEIGESHPGCEQYGNAVTGDCDKLSLGDFLG